jgi:hypothetical protein
MTSLKRMKKMAQLVPLGSRQGIFAGSCLIRVGSVFKEDIGADADKVEAVVDAGPITYSLWQGQAAIDLEGVMGGEAVADIIGSQSWCAHKAQELYLYLPVADTIVKTRPRKGP